MNNKLIVFEGIDGTGKTTICHDLNSRLLKLGILSECYEDAEAIFDGFNSIKPFIKKETPVSSSLFFYMASAIYKSHILSKLLRNKCIICDRYVYSTLAYHKARGANLSLIPPIEKLPIILPDYYFLLTVDEDVRIKRLHKKSETEPLDFYPKKPGSFFDRIEKCFLEFRPIVLDNSNPKTDGIIDKIINIIFK